MGYIYILTSPTGKSYIGQTIRPIKERLEEHRTGKSSGCRAIYNAIQKYGWENFEKDYYECPDCDLNKHEELMGEVLGTLAPGGYNLMKGGGSRGKPCEESKQKMSEAQLGEKNPMWSEHHSEETRKKQSDAMKGEKHPMWGEHHGEETRKKQSESKIGEKNHAAKRVYQYDRDGTFITSFGSCGEAARHLEKTQGTHIAACARGERKTIYKFKWSYRRDNMSFDPGNHLPI